MSYIIEQTKSIKAPRHAVNHQRSYRPKIWHYTSHGDGTNWSFGHIFIHKYARRKILVRWRNYSDHLQYPQRFIDNCYRPEKLIQFHEPGQIVCTQTTGWVLAQENAWERYRLSDQGRRRRCRWRHRMSNIILLYYIILYYTIL